MTSGTREIPSYLKCTRPELWDDNMKNNKGKVIFNTKTHFLYYYKNWNEVVERCPGHFIEATEEEYNKQEGIEVSIESYDIFN